MSDQSEPGGGERRLLPGCDESATEPREVGPPLASLAAIRTAEESGGDGLDLPQLISEYHAALYRYAYRLTGQQMDAEDLTQQTFLVAQQRLHQVRDIQKAERWLFAVLRNCYRKQLRKRVPQTTNSQELDIEQLAETTENATAVDREQLQPALNALPEDFRLIVVMFYFEQCSYREIAQQLEIPLGTVMSRLARAKGRLRQLLSVTDKPPVERTDLASGSAAAGGPHHAAPGNLRQPLYRPHRPR